MAVLLAQRLACVRGGRVIFRELNFSVQRGTVLLLHGPNGSGKSSLMRILAGDFLPAEGTLFYQGRDIGSMDPACNLYRRRVHYVEDEVPLSAEHTVWENLSLLNHIHMQVPSWILETSLYRAGLSKLRHKPAHQLSLGQRKRCVVATLLAGVNRPIWILDEPLIGLDSSAVCPVVISVTSVTM